MTTLQPNKPVIRETAAFYRAEKLIVELHPKTVIVRLKGKRNGTGAHVPYDAIYELAMRILARKSYPPTAQRVRNA